MSRDVEQLYWDNVSLTSRVSRLESHVADLERRLNDSFEQLQRAIGENTSATLSAIDDLDADWRRRRRQEEDR